jgi:hypothetical protein
MQKSSRVSGFGFGGIIIAIIVMVVVLPLITSVLYQRVTVKEVTVRVTSKDTRITGSGNEVKELRLVYTKDHGVFENSDALWHWKWNSSDVWANIPKTGTECKFRYYGWRITFFSLYPNIISAECSQLQPTQELF